MTRRSGIYLFLLSAAVLLSACGSGTSANQNTLTQAQMTTAGASCNEIVHSIHAMDEIIIDGGGTPTNYGGVASQTVNTGLYASGVARKVPGVSMLTNTVSSLSRGGQGNAIKSQQMSQAQREKQRLIGLFQQKGCRLVQ